ncbi:MAG: exosortase-associated EpsI family protein [Verrucomicrobiia bacterium]
MKSQKVLVFIIMLLLIGAAAGALTWLKKNQRLGTPGIMATPIPGSIKMTFDLPPHVLDYTSERVPEDKIVVDTLPKDTSFTQRRYVAPDGKFLVNGNIVLMGMDRTSIHKPEFCLPGQGWHIDDKTAVGIPIQGPHPYQLRVAKWTITNFIQDNDGQKQAISGLYVFWFVAKNEETDTHWQRIWWLTRDLLTKGVLQRWAYVSYFAVCQPGQEDATFDRMKKLIAASVPEFQLPPDVK